MKKIAQKAPQVNLTPQTPQALTVNPHYARLIAQVSERGYDPAQVSECLAQGVYLKALYTDARGCAHYEAAVLRPDLDRACHVQIIHGQKEQSAGCITCAQGATPTFGYNPYTVNDCPAVGAAIVAFVALKRDYGSYLQVTEVATPADVEIEVGGDITGDTTGDSEPADDPIDLPHPLTLAQQVAGELKKDYGQILGKRVDRALELAMGGQTDFPEYDTRVDLATMNRECDCPDAKHREIRLSFTGAACKHALAQYIAYRVECEQDAIAARKRLDKQEMRRLRGPVATNPQPAQVQPASFQPAYF